MAFESYKVVHSVRGLEDVGVEELIQYVERQTNIDTRTAARVVNTIISWCAADLRKHLFNHLK